MLSRRKVTERAVKLARRNCYEVRAPPATLPARGPSLVGPQDGRGLHEPTAASEVMKPHLLKSEVQLSFVGSNASLTSRAIEIFSAGDVSHVDAIDPVTGLLWGARYDKVGGKPRGFYGRPASYIAKETTHIIIAIPCTPPQFADFWKVTHGAEGMGYDWVGILAFSFGQNWHQRGKEFCSEAQRDHLLSAGILPKDFYAKGSKTTPMELLVALTARNDTAIVMRKGT